MQGGVAVIVQKLHSVICEQLGLSNVLDSECDSESYHDYETSDISDVEECTVETSCPLGGTCHRRKEGTPYFHNATVFHVNRFG